MHIRHFSPLKGHEHLNPYKPTDSNCCQGRFFLGGAGIFDSRLRGQNLVLPEVPGSYTVGFEFVFEANQPPQMGWTTPFTRLELQLQYLLFEPAGCPFLAQPVQPQVHGTELHTGGKPLRMRIDKLLAS